MSSEENKNMNEQEEIKRAPEGYESIIPNEIFEKVLEVADAVNELGDMIHAFNNELKDKPHPERYAMFQHASFLRFMHDAHEAMCLATQIHRLDKDFIDSSAKEQGMTTDVFVSKFLVQVMIDMMD